MGDRRTRRLSDFVCWLFEQLSRAGRLKEFPEFAFIENEDASDPHPEQLQKAIAVFDRLPAAEKSAILRGWSMPSASMFNREEIEAFQDADSTAPYLCIVSGDQHFSAAHEVSFDRQSAVPVRVLIRAGAGGPETIDALRRVIDVLETNWSDLITDNGVSVADRFGKEKSGASQNAGPLQPGSNGGSDAKTATAA